MPDGRVPHRRRGCGSRPRATTHIGFGALGPSFIGVVAGHADYTTSFGALAAALLVVGIESRTL